MRSLRPAVRYNGRVLEQFKAELAQRRLADGNSGGGASAGTAATASEQRQQAQQPAKRARVDSSSDLTGAAARRARCLLVCIAFNCWLCHTAARPAILLPLQPHSLPLPCLPACAVGGSVALSASFKDGDRNVLKLKFARSKKQLADSAAQPGGGYAAGPYAAQAQAEDAIDYQRSRPRRQVGSGGRGVLASTCCCCCWAPGMHCLPAKRLVAGVCPCVQPACLPPEEATLLV